MCSHDATRYRCPSGSCALCLADRNGPMTLDEVGAHLGVTRERVRQIEVQALGRLAAGLAQIDRDAFERVTRAQIRAERMATALAARRAKSRGRSIGG